MLSGTNGRLLRLSLQAAANGLVRNRLATVAATVTMTLMLLVLASVLVIRAGLDAALAYADSKVEVVAYLKLDATEAIADRLSAEIRGIDGVREIRFVSAEEALKEFRQRLDVRPCAVRITVEDPVEFEAAKLQAVGLRAGGHEAALNRVHPGAVVAGRVLAMADAMDHQHFHEGGLRRRGYTSRRARKRKGLRANRSEPFLKRPTG